MSNPNIANPYALLTGADELASLRVGRAAIVMWSKYPAGRILVTFWCVLKSWTQNSKLPQKSQRLFNCAEAEWFTRPTAFAVGAFSDIDTFDESLRRCKYVAVGVFLGEKFEGANDFTEC